jgi:hypothetical protein
VARGLPAIDVLKVAHHGSRTATTAGLLDVTRPAIAVISAGTGNPYGHPAPATLARLADQGAQTLRTDLNGDVEVRIQGGRLTVRPEREASDVAASSPDLGIGIGSGGSGRIFAVASPRSPSSFAATAAWPAADAAPTAPRAWSCGIPLDPPLPGA